MKRGHVRNTTQPTHIIAPIVNPTPLRSVPSNNVRYTTTRPPAAFSSKVGLRRAVLSWRAGATRLVRGELSSPPPRITYPGRPADNARLGHCNWAGPPDTGCPTRGLCLNPYRAKAPPPTPQNIGRPRVGILKRALCRPLSQNGNQGPAPHVHVQTHAANGDKQTHVALYGICNMSANMIRGM